jgi:ribosomal protein L44E
MISQTLKDNSKVFGMFFLALGIDENIIDKDHDEFVELCHKHRVHEVHEVGWGIRESKRHYQELVKTITSGEGGFRNVTRSNLDLVITRTKVNFREDFGSSQLIEKNIDSGKRVFVFDADCIERSVIYTHYQATIFLLDKESRATLRRRARANITLI